MGKIIPYGKQWIDDYDIEAVTKVLKSDYLTQGDWVPNFEKALSSYTGSRYCLAVTSGTSALHMAYFALGIGEGDEIITTPMTFAATANAALYLGAKPVFVDIVKDTGLIDIDKIESAITEKTKAIVPVHYAGLSVGAEKIAAIAKKYNLLIIEDACHALGARDGGKIGGCKYSDATVFSFHPVKHITTGEGGAVIFKDEKAKKRGELFRSHGINKKSFISTPDSPSYQEMVLLGYNYRMTEMQAALGYSQLKKMDKFLEGRRHIANIYQEYFKNITDILTPIEPKGSHHAYHLFPLLFENNSIRDKVYYTLKNNGIMCQIHYIPVNSHYYYKTLGYKSEDTPVAYDFYRRELSIPIYPKLTDDDACFVAESVIKALEGAK